MKFIRHYNPTRIQLFGGVTGYTRYANSYISIKSIWDIRYESKIFTNVIMHRKSRSWSQKTYFYYEWKEWKLIELKRKETKYVWSI